MSHPVSRRALFSASTGIAAAAVLAACGSNSGLSSGSSASSGGSGAALSQWYHEYGEDGVQAAVTKYAAAYTKDKVTVKWNPGDYETAVGAALLTQTVPDVFEYANGPTADMIVAGQVLDLTDALGSAKSQFNQALITPRIFRDKIWAIPQTIDMQMLYYRKSVLVKAGVQPPTTFAELVDAAAKVTTKDMGGFFAGNDSGVGVLGLPLIWSAGFNSISSDGKGVDFDDPAFYSALTAYKAFRDGTGLLRNASTDWFDATPFINGECAMQWTGLWALPKVKAAFNDDFGVVAFPAIGSAGKVSVAAGAYGACVAAKGVDPDAAKAFVKWLWVDSDDDQIEFSTAFGTHIPAKPSLAAKAGPLSSGAGQTAAKLVADSGHVTDIRWTNAIGTAYSSALTNVIVKGANPKTELATVVSTAKTELAKLA
jgi:multiple sugar transport system substrate-binding protein